MIAHSAKLGVLLINYPASKFYCVWLWRRKTSQLTVSLFSFNFVEMKQIILLVDIKNLLNLYELRYEIFFHFGRKNTHEYIRKLYILIEN